MTVVLANIPAVWMFLAGCALLTFILLKRSYRYFGRRRRNGTASPLEHLHRPDSVWDGAKRDAMARIERQEVEMQEMARDINGQLGSKVLLLEKMIADSQRQIERMEQLLSEMEHVQGCTKVVQDTKNVF